MNHRWQQLRNLLCASLHCPFEGAVVCSKRARSNARYFTTWSFMHSSFDFDRLFIHLTSPGMQNIPIGHSHGPLAGYNGTAPVALCIVWMWIRWPAPPLSFLFFPLSVLSTLRLHLHQMSTLWDSAGTSSHFTFILNKMPYRLQSSIHTQDFQSDWLLVI